MNEKEKLLQNYSREKEEEVRRFWEKKKIPEKARAQNAKSKKNFYLMDGPPYATGHIHMGTALNKVVKDVVIRSQRMQGKNVFDRAGYDTHGLPIEHNIEKKHGFEGKKDIEKFGVEKFIKECREFATQFIGTMSSEFNNLGVWMDWENPYITLENYYIEAIWATFKKAEEKGLLYLGKYPTHICPRCATAVAFNEIEYEKLADQSVYVKFPVKGEEKKFLIIWTTTPWTLPGNTGIMVHPKYEYVEAEVMGETWIIAKELFQGLIDAVEAGYVIKKTIKGKELEGMEYENPLAKNLKLGELKNAYRVILSDRYVTLDAGTGLVHTAPGYGKEDFDAGTKNNLPVVSTVELNGEMNELAGKYAGKKARVVDEEIINDLKEMNALVYQHPYTHDYPTCWRCKTPLLQVGTPQWFFKISAIQKKALKESNATYWVPNWAKDRMKNWLEGIGDWPVSRKRYWGTPLPIWLCEKCSKRKVIGSIAELKENAKIPGNFDLHKPGIDEITFKCKCGGRMKRVPDVMDVWFDSGVSSWAALGYPKEKKLFEKFWPADFNAEATDQFRGWWNSQMLCSLICFDKKPFKAIMVHGMVTDLEKVKMSKSKGNIVSPQEVIEKYNRDYLRYYLVSESKGLAFGFEWKAFEEINRFFNIFWNTFNYIKLYHGFEEAGKKINAKLEAEDKWILSKLNSLIEETTENYNKYFLYKNASLINYFVLEELSRTYIKLVRNRTEKKTAKAVKQTLNNAMLSLLQLMSPITPHAAEYFYQGMREADKKFPESIHLMQLPKADKKMVDKALEKEMELVKELSQAVLALREENKLRLRWPLKEIVLVSEKPKIKKLSRVLAAMSNVEKVGEAKKEPKGNYASKQLTGTTIYLNLEADEKLKEQWELMELRRKIQDARKQAKCNPKETIKLIIACSDAGFLKKFKKEIEENTNTKLVEGKGPMKKLLEKEFFFELKK